jgi:hypothetical protein
MKPIEIMKTKLEGDVIGKSNRRSEYGQCTFYAHKNIPQ